MKKSKFIETMRPILSVIPEISPPETKQYFRDKLAWTAVTVLIFLACANIPLYGINMNIHSDPFYWMRVMLASNKGTLMELGISPIITSSMVMQFLKGAQIINFDSRSKEHKAIFEASEKLLGLAIVLVQSVLYVSSGVYGDFNELGAHNFALIVIQLFLAGTMVVLLDEVLTKGYGLGSGVQLFIAVNVCERVVWSALSFRTMETSRGPEYEGALIAFLHMLLWSRSDKIMAFRDAFYRSDLPNVTSIIATGLVFVAAIYFQGYRIDLAVKYTKVRGQMGNYPIKLFYTGNMPMILQSALVGNIYFFSQMLYSKFKTSFLVGLIGTWQQVDVTGNSVPVGGLAYYISPPQSILGIFTDPFHIIFYFLFMVIISAFLSWKWIEVSGTSARDVARQLKDQNLTIPGHRDGQLATVLSRYIPQAAALGGVCVALLTIVADLLGCIGGGTGILLAVTIVYSFFETIMKEREQNGGFL